MINMPYEETPLSSLPEAIDNIERMSDVSLSELQLVRQFEEFMLDGNLQAAGQILQDNPGLKNKFLNAEKYNKLRDAIIALEKIYIEDIKDSLDNFLEFADSVPLPSNESPRALANTAQAGISTNYARADHVHRLPTPSDIGALSVDGTAVNSAKLGGQLPEYYLNYNNLTNKPIVFQLTNYAAEDLANEASSGSATTAARADHRHKMPSLADLGISIGTTPPDESTPGVIYFQY
jgi:hypothetical protein